MNTPRPEQFAEFYKAVHGKAADPNFGPFPWQVRLAQQVCAGDWPRAIALPTAAGKTACIDIAVYALACRTKNAPRRIFFVVDRRIVVNQAYLHALQLAKVLREAKTGILHDVAQSLRDLAQDKRPLDVYALRGGMYRETAWARSPIQPSIIAATVDQVGSRLLFRGYGVSDSMKPIHAGLVGNDALILLDEAHCARPFDQTVRAVETYRTWGQGDLAPFRFVSITATPTNDAPTLRDEDEDRDHPVLGKRLMASKPTKLVVAERAKGSKGRAELVKVLMEQAKALGERFACVGIIVNRVATARELKARLGEEAVLLTGRIRPLDRDRVFQERLQPLLSSAEGTPPRFVIGTQCLECGADFDFHALVCECASLDALRQRFGRLNRIARRPVAEAVIVIRADQTEDTADDPVYGASLANTWKWLKDKATSEVFDFGVLAVRKSIGDEDIGPLNAPADNAPVLFPTHLDCWVQTHPVPMPDPDPALFLHGPTKPGQPDVQVVLRQDLGPDEKKWADVVALCPPSSSEAVAVPIGLFKKWLAGDPLDDQSGDVEGEAVPADGAEEIRRFALRWRGPDSSSIVAVPDDVTPNDLYMLPCSADEANSLGDFPFGLTDLAEEAFQRSRDRAILRLLDSTLSQDNTDDFDTRLTEAIQARLTDSAQDWLKRAVQDLADPRKREVEPHPRGGWVVSGKRRLGQFDPTYLEDSEPAESFRGRPVSLVEHSRGVARFARQFAAGCGLDGDLFAQAGFWHDLGKLDPRFQAMLKQSSPRTAVGEPLAKSARSPRTKEEREQAREVHRYPSGARHELLSAALLASKTDDDLLLHLIATHHGSGRPFADPVQENEAVKQPFATHLFGEQFELATSGQQIAAWNAELPERFWRIVRKCGWWGAAYRETILRLADHAQSRAEQEKQEHAAELDTRTPPPFPLHAEPRRLYPLPLPGLDGSNPLAFLASLGTLRLADGLFPGGAQLRWERAGRWQPVLELPRELSDDEFLDRLHQRVHQVVDSNSGDVAEQRHKTYRARKKETEKAMKSVKERRLRGKEREEAIAADVAPLLELELATRQEWLAALDSAVPAPFLSLGKSIAVSAEEFTAFASRAAERLRQCGPAGRADADFIPSFGSEACVDRNGRVIPTEFQLITGSGHQFFLETFAALMESVTISQLRRSLFGPWTYSDPRLSFRWDPVDDRRYAMTWNDPSSMEVRTEHGANLLAAFALPFFPVVPEKHGATTTGFDTRSREPRFTWPICTIAHGPDAIRSLLQLSCLKNGTATDAQKRQYGVRCVFQVRKFEVGKPPLSKLNLSPAFTV